MSARTAADEVVATVVRRGLPPLLLGAILVKTVAGAAAPLGNTDTYFHLRFGRAFLDGTWSVADPGRVSRFGTADWVPTQWVPQVVMARAEESFGLPGVAWLAGLQVVALVVTVYVVARHRASPLVASAITVVVLLACGPGLSMRPQVLSFVLVAVTVAAWSRARERDTVPWLLVPLTWVWAMTHGMWFVGVVIGLVAWAGAALDLGVRTRRSLQRLAVPVLSLLVACLTPVGPSLLSAVLLVGSRGKYFTEWGTPAFSTVSSWLVLVLLGGTLLGLARATEARFFDLALVGLAGAFTIYSVRTLPVAAVMLAPVAAGLLQARSGDDPLPVRRPEGLLLAGGALASLAVLAALVPSRADSPVDRPDWLDTRLAAMPAGTGVVSGWGEGGYLMWRFPQVDLLMHGYGDVFTTDELDRNVAIRSADPGWDELLRDTGVEVAVLDPATPLAYALERSGWDVVEESATLELLVAPDDW